MSEVKQPSQQISVRKALVSDAAKVAELNINSWKKSYKGIISQDFLDSLDFESRIPGAARRAERADMDCLVAVDANDNVVGFADFGPCREKNIDADVELYAIYIEGSFQGHGIGKDLFLSGFKKSVERQYKKLMVSVLYENHRAKGFYEKMGGRPAGFDKVVLGEISYPTATYIWNLQ